VEGFLLRQEPLFRLLRRPPLLFLRRAVVVVRVVKRASELFL
jgi:hypothetical protein